MSAGIRLAGQLALGIGLCVLGYGLIKVSGSVSDALPVIAAAKDEISQARQDVNHIQQTLPETAREAGEQGGRGFVKGAVKEGLKTASDPSGAVVDAAVKDKKTADAVKVLTNPGGFVLSKVF
jgi:hypothetical protein